MIYLKRGAAPDSLKLSEQSGQRAKRELDDARQYFQETDTGPPSNHFSAYAKFDVRNAIHDQFLGKCIYCEKRVERTSELNIEHYRPKGKIDDCPDHPGYWWLAMRWDNLLPSCRLCNSATYRPIIEPNMSVEDIKVVLVDRSRWSLRGKQNFFPTEDGFWARNESSNLSDETPLLIDPSEIDPEPLFEWRALGSYILALPKDNNRQARTTIETLGLNRVDLCEDRMLAIRGIPEKQAWIETNINSGDIDDMIDEQTLEELTRFVAALENCIHETQPHAAVARYALHRLEERLASAVA